jgi:hypothetical protein
MASSLFEVFSSGPKTRKLSMFLRMMSRSSVAERLGVHVPDGAGASTGMA